MSYPLPNQPDLPTAKRLQVTEKLMDVILQVQSGPLSGKYFRVPVGHSVKIGRSAESDIAFANDIYISRSHFSLDWDGSAWWIKDLNSRHGTFVNETLVEKSRLQEGDTIRVGFTVMVVRLLAHDSAASMNSGKEGTPTTVSAALVEPEPMTAETLRPNLSVRPAKA